jgi:hypothetical protein
VKPSIFSQTLSWCHHEPQAKEIPDEGPLHVMSASSMNASGFLAQRSK